MNPALSVGMGSDVKGLDSPVYMSVPHILMGKTHECGRIPRFTHGDVRRCVFIVWLPGASWFPFSSCIKACLSCYIVLVVSSFIKAQVVKRVVFTLPGVLVVQVIWV